MVVGRLLSFGEGLFLGYVSFSMVVYFLGFIHANLMIIAGVYHQLITFRGSEIVVDSSEKGPTCFGRYGLMVRRSVLRYCKKKPL